ncbi:hypothetical protein CKF43_16740 [Pantoea graminicola]|uniref:hypothetical protein n=1 Tax=Pantoea sp. KXB45 TaxID=3402309 RepID=UPI000DA6DDE2|nr:hypothetical protein CKF43_16740 [Pantoea sp. ARC607]
MSFYGKHETTPLESVDARYRKVRSRLIAAWLAQPDLPAIYAQLDQAKKRSSSALLRRKLKEFNAREMQEAGTRT